MQKIDNWDNVKASGDFERLPNGAYLCTIINVEDKADRQYLNIEYDICDGQYIQFATDAYKNLGFWILSTCRSYKSGCEEMFKAFTNAVEGSNDGYEWNWDESTLAGKDVGMVIVTEHYLKNTGDLGLRYKVKSVFPTSKYGKYADKVYEDAWTEEAKKFGKPTPEMEAVSNPFAK